MKENNLVTIITPCYNGELFLNGYFEAILNQTYKELEVIFVNDGSTDNTEIIALKYGELLKQKGIQFIYIYQENSGQAHAMNTAFQYMHGDYMVWPDSDDLLATDSIEKRVSFLKKNPEYSFVRSNGYYFDFDTKKRLYRISNLENRFHEDIFLDLILERTYCCCGCYMIRTKVLKEFYPDLTIYESSAGQNWQILIPIAGKYKCGFIDEDLYAIANRAGSHSRKKRNLEELLERYAELRKILEIAINISKRNDRDYDRLLEVKYRKINMRIYLDHSCIEKAKEEYKWLKARKALDSNDYQTYLKKTRPSLFRIYECSMLILRLKNKIKRKLCCINEEE